MRWRSSSRKDLARVNSYLPDGARVRKFVLLHKEFDPDEAELTRTRKIRREFMEQRYKDLIDAIYGDKDKVDVQAPVTYRDGAVAWWQQASASGQLKEAAK